MKRTLLLLGFLFLSFAARAHELTTRTITPARDGGVYLIASNGKGFLSLVVIGGRFHVSPAGADGRPVSALPRPLPDDVHPSQLVGMDGGYAGVGSSSSGLRFVRFGADGSIVSQRLLQVSAFPVSLAWNGRNLLLAVNHPASYRLTGYFLSPDGEIIRELGPLGPETFPAHAATASGETFYVASGTTNGTNVYRISPDGAIDAIYRDPLGLPRSIAARPNGFALLTTRNFTIFVNGVRVFLQEPPKANAVAATSGGYVLLEFSEVTRFDANGQRIDGVPIAGAAVAAAGDVVEVLTARDAAWFRFSARPAVVERALIAAIWTPQIMPAAASDGAGFLASWHEQNAGGEAVTSARFARDPHPLDGPGITTAPVWRDAKPAVAFGAGRYLVVWNDETKLSAMFIGLDGVAAPPFALHNGIAANPAVAWNGTSFFVVWSEGQRILGTTVSTFGATGEARLITPVSRTAAPDIKPDVAWDGAQHLVVWLHAPATGAPGGCVILPCSPPATEVLAARVGLDGTPIDASPITVISTPLQPIDAVHIAAGGASALLTIDRPARIDIAELRFDGAASAPRALFEWLPLWGEQRAVASDVAFDGSGYAVGWRYQDSWNSFIAAERILPGGSFAARRAMNASFAVPSIAASVAANAAGEAAIVTSEILAQGESPRVTATFAADLPLAPQPPPTPANLAAHLAGFWVTVTWGAVEGAEGYVIENENGALLGNAPAGSTTFSILYAYRGTLRIRAYNAGGVSAPSSAVTVQVLPRRRSARH